MQDFNMSPVAVGLAAVKLALLQQESQEIQKSTIPAHEDTISQSVLITMGLDLEELQCVVRWSLVRPMIYLFSGDVSRVISQH